MARLVLNDEDLSAKLRDFTLRCVGCGSDRVTLDIDWGAYPSSSWCSVTVICEECHRDECVNY